MKLLVALALALSVAAACDGCGHIPPAPPTPGDGTCAQVCTRGRELHCAWAEKTMQGHPCEDVCENANDPAGPIHWDMACRVRAASCDEEARCQ